MSRLPKLFADTKFASLIFPALTILGLHVMQSCRTAIGPVGEGALSRPRYPCAEYVSISRYLRQYLDIKIIQR